MMGSVYDQLVRGKTALVTGASSGLGVEFARELAARGCHLVLVARREALLRQQAEALHHQFGVHVTPLVCDLARPEASQQLFEQLQATGTTIDVLINNAGYGLYGPFQQIDWQRERAMLELDIITVVHLTRLFVAEMVARNFGFVLQVASIAAYQPTPLYASYGAAKAFVLHHGEALNYELRHTNVNVCVVAPGITATEFLAVSGQQPTLYQRLMMMDSPSVARIGVAAMLRGRTSVIPGRLNTLNTFVQGLLPRRLQTALAELVMR